MAFEFRRLHPLFGVEITGLDLTRLDHSMLRRVVTLWVHHGLVVFRDQDLSPDQQLDFSRRLGILDPAPAFDNDRSALAGYPEIAVVSNIKVDGKPIGGLGDGELAWHSDMTYVESPPIGCVLHARELPSEGGDTFYLDLRAAWASLPEDLRAAASRGWMFHDRAYTSAGTRRRDRHAAEGAWHAVRIEEPLGGQPCLLLGRRRGGRIETTDGADDALLLDALWQHADQPAHVYRHAWRAGDVILWNNIATMHRRDAFSASDRRLLHRTQIRQLATAWQPSRATQGIPPAARALAESRSPG